MYLEASIIAKHNYTLSLRCDKQPKKYGYIVRNLAHFKLLRFILFLSTRFKEISKRFCFCMCISLV